MVRIKSRTSSSKRMRTSKDKHAHWSKIWHSIWGAGQIFFHDVRSRKNHKNRHSSDTLDQAGFVMWEAAVALMVSGVLGAGIISMMRMHRQAEQGRITRQHMDQVIAALAQHFSRTGALPYPGIVRAGQQTEPDNHPSGRLSHEGGYRPEALTAQRRAFQEDDWSQEPTKRARSRNQEISELSDDSASRLGQSSVIRPSINRSTIDPSGADNGAAQTLEPARPTGLDTNTTSPYRSRGIIDSEGQIRYDRSDDCDFSATSPVPQTSYGMTDSDQHASWQSALGKPLVGVVPFRTLGLPEKVAKDGHGAWLTYAVDPTALWRWHPSRHALCRILFSAPSLVKVRASGAWVNAQLTTAGKPQHDGVAFVLISHGKGKGAFDPAGGADTRQRITLLPQSSLCKQQNCQDHLTFCAQPDSHDEGIFDDVVLWRTRTQLLAEGGLHCADFFFPNMQTPSGEPPASARASAAPADRFHPLPERHFGPETTQYAPSLATPTIPKAPPGRFKVPSNWSSWKEQAQATDESHPETTAQALPHDPAPDQRQHD